MNTGRRRRRTRLAHAAARARRCPPRNTNAIEAGRRADMTQQTSLFIASALAAAIAMSAADAQAGPAPKLKYEAEKCYGVAKAGKNDCQTANSSCAGTSRRDGQKDAWIYVPAGSCERLVNGSLQPRA